MCNTMANKKYERTVIRTINAITDWCLHFGYSINKEGNFAVYITADNNDLHIKSTLREFLMDVLDVSKKRLDELISILKTRGRVYILFKKRMSCR